MKRGLRLLNVCSKLWVTVGLIVILTASNHDAFAGTVKGHEAGTFVRANFTYDGASNAGLATYKGDDNIGGPFSGQDLEEYSLPEAAARRLTAAWAQSLFSCRRPEPIRTSKGSYILLA